jgi:hypothetical protein|tara:strand:- start:15 stop:314 length:300 start_codon:yes stop_codon:yes gene_type:complete
MNKYYVVEEGGTFREFAKSHEGLEDAIEFAHDIMGEVMCNQEGGGAEAIWSYESHLNSFTPDTDWDGFNSDAEADADALASAGYGTDEDYGGCNDCYDC